MLIATSSRKLLRSSKVLWEGGGWVGGCGWGGRWVGRVTMCGALQHRSHEIAMLLGETAPGRSHGHVAPGNGHTVGPTKSDRLLGVLEPDVKRCSRDALAVLPHARTPSSLTGRRAIYQGTIYQGTARRTASIVRSSPKVLRRCRPSSKGEAKSFLHSWTVPLRRPHAPPLRVLRSADWASGATLRRLQLGVWAVAGRGGGGAGRGGVGLAGVGLRGGGGGACARHAPPCRVV